MAQAGLKRAQDFTWEPFENDLVKNLESAIDAYEASGSATEAENQGESSTSEEEVGIRTDSDEDSGEKVRHLIEGQGEIVDGQKQKDSSGKEAV